MDYVLGLGSCRLQTISRLEIVKNNIDLSETLFTSSSFLCPLNPLQSFFSPFFNLTYLNEVEEIQ